MSKKVQLTLSILCAVMILALPLLVPSGRLLESAEERLNEAWEATEEESEASLFDFLFSRAYAEEDAEKPARKLPIDFSAGMQPNPACFTENGYKDDSITVTMETRDEGDTVYCIAFVTIADASQLRTAVAGTTKKGVPNKSTAKLSSMARKMNAVVAINGDLYVELTDKKTFETRMGVNIRRKKNQYRSALIIDENGDFHVINRLADLNAVEKELKDAGHEIVNAFTFGPALVINGEVLKQDEKYAWNPNEREPRMAIGQTGKLSYVLVMAEGRTKNSKGATHQELADYMGQLGCLEAFNLDGGNTAEMIFNGEFYGSRKGNERDQSDMIYFASAVDPSEWQ